MTDAGEAVKYARSGDIAFIKMEDRASRNTFSTALIGGLLTAFRAVAADPQVKVVVISGYDNYFCCGGTKEELLTLQRGEAVFTETREGGVPFFDLLLRCKVPVVAAMQGHALGGGLAFGCFADILVLGEENVYSANFMSYGFTPGMGATYTLPKKLGALLGNEMLFSARNYFGKELRERGVQARVAPKREVLNVAHEIAQDLANKPRTSLMLLKESQIAETVRDLPGVIEREVAMHRVSFAQPEVRARIEAQFVQPGAGAGQK